MKVMPRMACPEEARATLHVVQRGRRPCFSCAKDRAAYLAELRLCSGRQACAVHAYALMGNHVHLLFTSEQARGPSRLIPDIVWRYARYLCDEYGHEGAVWDEPYDATPVYTRAQFLACMRYVEENPVRAGLARSPGAWRWSSYRANALGEDDPLVTPHPDYYALGRSPAERQSSYAALFVKMGISSADGRGSQP